MSIIWAFQIFLDAVFVAALVKFFFVRSRRLSLEDLEEGLGISRKSINTPLGSTLSTLTEKRANSSAEKKSSEKSNMLLSENSALFSNQPGLRVKDAKRLLNQGLSLKEVSRKTGLSQAELSLLEKTILGGMKDLF